VAGADAAPQPGLDRVVAVHRHERGSRRHHLARLLLVQVEHALEHVRLVGVQLAVALAAPDQHAQLLCGRRLAVAFDLDPQNPADHEVGGVVQRPDHGMQPDAEPLQRPGAPARDRLGVRDRRHLRRLLADDHVRRRHQQVGERHRDRNGKAVAHDAAEQRLQQRRDSRLAEEAEPDRRERDADLRRRQVTVDVIHLVQRHHRGAGAVLGGLLHACAASAHQRELRGHEETVQKDQHDQQD
jgi:hypothetical protein